MRNQRHSRARCAGACTRERDATQAANDDAARRDGNALGLVSSAGPRRWFSLSKYSISPVMFLSISLPSVGFPAEMSGRPALHTLMRKSDF